MELRYSSARVAFLLFVLLVDLLTSRPAAAAELTQTRARVQAALQCAPLYFEANEGQTDRRVQFLARGQGYSLFLTPREAVLVLRKASREQRGEKGGRRTRKPLSPAPSPLHASQSAVLRMQLLGANPHPKASGQEQQPGQVNYFLGNDPAHWRTNVPTFQKVRYNAVYPGIDLVYYGNPQQLEYDFVVKPGANPGKIALSFAGVERLRIDRGGELVLQTASGEVRWHRPVVYQQIHGKREPVAARYVLERRNSRNTHHASRITFQVAKYDTTKPLVIDPVLAYSTYLGGSDYDTANGVVVDAEGHIYVAGLTHSPDFPTKNQYQGYDAGQWDAFVTKLDSTKSGAAQLLYSTYLGGRYSDQATGIVVDAAGYVYLTGETSSSDFPTQNAYQSVNMNYGDVFVTKLDLTRSGATQLLYSTYLGGSLDDIPSGEGGNSIAVDGVGIVYVTGLTLSTNFPTKNAFQGDQLYYDAFVTKLDTTRVGAASLLYSTYLGGSGSDFGNSIAVDAAGYVYVAGITLSSNFPTKNAYQGSHQGDDDVFVVKLDTTKSGTAQLLYSTYLGGGDYEYGGGIVLAEAGCLYVSGGTQSANFPAKNAFQGSLKGERDAFVTKIDTTQSGEASLANSTYLGGDGRDDGDSIAIDAAGYVYVTGYTNSTDFPTQNAFQGGLNGFGDAFVTKLDTTKSGAAQLLYSTYLGGGSGWESGWSVAVDAVGNIYVAGHTGSPDFPIMNAFQGDQGDVDAFVTKIAQSVTEAIISGSITLEDCVNPVQPLTFTFRPTDGSPASSRTLMLNADGTFTLTHLMRKNYLLAIKGAKWLQKVVSVDASNGDVTHVSALLPAGDATNDNIVDVNDLAALIEAFDAAPASPNWNGGMADFDCNDIVDVEDLSLLIRNFDLSGDP